MKTPRMYIPMLKEANKLPVEEQSRWFFEQFANVYRQNKPESPPSRNLADEDVHDAILPNKKIMKWFGLSQEELSQAVASGSFPPPAFHCGSCQFWTITQVGLFIGYDRDFLEGSPKCPAN